MNEQPLKYEVVIYWSDEDEAFVAQIPELPGCVADGPTPQQALANVEAIAREWIDTALEDGRDVPAPKAHLLSA